MEYQSIADRFSETIPACKIVKIQRNQNRKLWMWYLLRRQEVSKKNKNNANEKFLFHGSRANAYNTILKEGLDHRVALLTGAIGAGIYFAQSASTSHAYVSQDNYGTKQMLLCRVTVGDVGKGNNQQLTFSSLCFKVNLVCEGHRRKSTIMEASQVTFNNRNIVDNSLCSAV